MKLEKLSVVIPLPNIGKDPPFEVKLFHWGLNETEKGPFILTEWGAKQILAKYQKRGRPLTFDKNHKMLDPLSTAEDQEAMGYFLLELRKDGLWATNIRWTPDAVKKIRTGKYGFISPAVWKDALNRVYDVINTALTCLPATMNPRPLLLSQTGESFTMDGMDNEPEMMNDESETLRTQVKPLRQLMNALAGCLSAVQSTIGSYKDGPIHEFAQSMMSSLPDWVQSAGALIEQMDPNALEEAEENQEADQEAKEIEGKEVGKMMPKEKEEKEKLSSLYTLCQDVTGEKDLEKMRGKLRAMKQNEKSMLLQLSQVKQNEMVALVDKGIAEGHIPPAERAEFLTLSHTELSSFLAAAIPLFSYEKVVEKPVKIEALKRSNAPADPIDESYLQDANEIFARANN